MQPLIRSPSISTAPSLARYCGNCPQTPISGMAYGWLPACRWQFWQARLLPANRIPGSDTAGPISFAVSAKSACPYLTSFPNGSSPTMAISGGVHCVKSILMGSAAGEARAVIQTPADNVATSAMSQAWFITHLRNQAPVVCPKGEPVIIRTAIDGSIAPQAGRYPLLALSSGVSRSQVRPQLGVKLRCAATMESSAGVESPKGISPPGPGHRRRSPAPGSHRTWRADFPHQRSSGVGSQHCERLQLRVWEAQFRLQ